MLATPSVKPASKPTQGRILISDDDAASREVLAEILERAGFSCAAVETTAESLAQLQRENFDLVVADILMPGNAALEMVRTIGERENAPPVILVTGHPTIETAQEAVRLRAFDYLLKPVDATKLVTLARAGVASSRMMQTLRAHRARLSESLTESIRCEEIWRSASGSAVNAALSTYLGLAVQQSLATIADVGDLAKAIVAQDASGGIEQRLQSSRPLVLMDAIRETIQILESTKSSFKSRELAELRRKLEVLIGSDSGS